MASQAIVFAETIAGMKKAIKRKAYDSDSENSIEELTNRGNKLRKKARFVHEGQLAPPTGPQVYRRRVEHAGFYRDIISLNPPLVDEDGYEVDSDDDNERAQIAMAAAAEFDPYADIRIENLLAPLTAASDLPDHPTLSKPFTSKTLTELTRHAGEMVQKERTALWRIKHLLTRLSGDSTWIPCEVVETENDFSLFIDEHDRHQKSLLGKVISRDEGDQLSTGTLASEETEQPVRLLTSEAHPLSEVTDAAKTSVEKPTTEADVTMTSAEDTADSGEAKDLKEAETQIPAEVRGDDPETESIANAPDGPFDEEAMDVDNPAKTLPAHVLENQTQDREELDDADGEADGVDQDGLPAPHRMRTRAQAQAASDNTAESRTRSITPDSNDDTFVHPYFLAPRASHPDRNIGLPQSEAEEIRKLLQLYIQKQEEVCRGAQRVYHGLLKADRYRKSILKWAKAEAHVGVNRDMSDGEDWYDKEEWGLDADLKKGQDEEEEDAATTAKKTRTRRQ